MYFDIHLSVLFVEIISKKKKKKVCYLRKTDIISLETGKLNKGSVRYEEYQKEQSENIGAVDCNAMLFRVLRE